MYIKRKNIFSEKSDFFFSVKTLKNSVDFIKYVELKYITRLAQRSRK